MTPIPPSPPVAGNVPDVVAQIQKALETLPSDADSPWVNLDKMPYIHKTDDPKASPWSCAVVGRFDYLQTMDYMLACQPANIRALLSALSAQEAEVGRLREALQDLLGGVGECLTSQGQRAIDCPVGIKARQVLFPDAALTQGETK